ncbi:hypothetical protein OH799_12915 [Nocardia sp. NBC_00881]|uniref:hypothetical protein n=1 Tax=Nocardia sp. NBC_00881 TaxID=2975995 RepID=UPI00386EB063|nr:hypothetical protein OH799_12915 [Nocardia sp. NBC_00881]
MARGDVAIHSFALRLPLPAFNWADRDTRWTYITGDLLPRHIDLEPDPVLVGAVLGEPFWPEPARGRLVSRLPDLLADLTAHRQIVE